MGNTKRVNVVLSGKEKRYFEEIKKDHGKDSQALRKIINDHEKISNMKY